MSRSQVARCISVMLLAAASTPLLSNKRDHNDDKIALAKQIVRQLYPELTGRGLYFTIADESTLDSEGGSTHFAMHVLQPVKGVAAVPERCPPSLITVGFVFPVEGDDRIHSLHAGGPTVNMDENGRLRELVDEHPDWSDKKVEEVLRNAGVHFGPWAKDALVNSLPMPVLNLLLGEVQITAMKFVMRDEKQMQEGLHSAALSWGIEMSSHMEGRQDERYFATFEPFRGRLIGLLQLPMSHSPTLE